jgi:hypothetical protein
MKTVSPSPTAHQLDHRFPIIGEFTIGKMLRRTMSLIALLKENQ